MRRSGIGSGGGYRMNKNIDSRAPKTEPRSRSMSPGGVNQLGAMQGDHVTHRGDSTGYKGEALVRGKGYEPPGMISDPVKAVGVGGGRTIHQTGSQGMQGRPAPGNPRPVPREHIISSFGPDYRKP